MNISKTSWHYRILNKLGMLNTYKVESLCPYFWKVVLVSLFGPFALVAVLWLGTLPLWWSFVDRPPFVLAIIVGSIEVVVLSFALDSIVRDRHEKEIQAGTRSAPIQVIGAPKEPSLFRLWLKAKHRKVCPLIDFVND